MSRPWPPTWHQSAAVIPSLQSSLWRLVERGLLIPGSDGFELKPGCDVSIPGNLLEVWNGRLRDLVVQHPEEALFAIEIGAVLGNNVDRGEWTDALNTAGIHMPENMLSELLRLRLIIREDALCNGHSSTHCFERPY